MKALLALLLLVTSLSLLAQRSPDPQNLRLKSLIHWSDVLPKGHGVRVAIIDSGIIQGFPAQVLAGWNFSDESSDVTDLESHGTGSASVIWSLVSEVQMIPLKVTHGGSARVESLNSAIVHAIESGVEIINLSIGFGRANIAEIKSRVSIEEFNRTLFIAAAGNQGEYIASPLAENVLIVGATLLDPPIRYTTYSGWGPGVEIAAPAGGSVNDGISVIESADPLTYRFFNGTSAAAPVVTAAAVMMKEKNPRLNGRELKEALLQAASSEMGLEGKVSKKKFLRL